MSLPVDPPLLLDPHLTMFTFQCDLAAQDCPTLWPNGSGYSPLDVVQFTNDFDNNILAFTTSSCVQDLRLSGTVGRCGFPGAPCSILLGSFSNCASGFASTCVNGVCAGAVGSSCPPGTPVGNTAGCNFGMSCGSDSLCGGAGSTIQTNEHLDVGLDIGVDCCVSGVSAIRGAGSLLQACAAGPPHVIPSASASSSGSQSSSSSATASTSSIPSSASTASHKATPVGIIAGGVVAGVVGLALLLAAFCLRRKKELKQPEKQSPASPAFSPNSSSRLPTLTSGTASPYILERSADLTHWEMRGKELAMMPRAHQPDIRAVPLTVMAPRNVDRDEHPPGYDFV
ncbi:hypothetical protein K438DRAFT_1985624 [Mycena galopus ATCC 62051]|nr:hypothetical protein K438DRAFT_1985624 [Mycena galopus ATCC 62051]